MSSVFFQQLDLPEPDVNLGVGSGSHAAQTAAVMVKLEEVFAAEPPSLVVVYGDVNSTVAAALVASKLGIPTAHVEAGLRSFDMTMPEEINRIVTDRLSDLLFATSADAVAHLGNEGVAPDKIHLVGNPMIDTLLAHLDRFGSDGVPPGLGLPQRYAVATLHRPGNVDDVDVLATLVEAMHRTADQVPIVMPVHPRGRQRMTAAGLFDHPGMLAIEPAGLHRVPQPGPPVGAGRHRLRRHPGGDHDPRRAVPDPAAQHRAPGHHHAWDQPAHDAD